MQTRPVLADSIRATIGNVFAPQSKLTAQEATFTAYYAALAKVMSAARLPPVLHRALDFAPDDRDGSITRCAMVSQLGGALSIPAL